MAELDTARIAAAALAIADERGAAGFTMRAVAEALEVTPMALYYHVADKTALVALVVDQASLEVPLPEPTGDWRDDLVEVANWTRGATAAHPAVTELRREYQVWTTGVLPVTERWYSIWQRSGLDSDDAFRAATLSGLSIVGIAAEDARFENIDLSAASELPGLVTATERFRSTRDSDADFEFVVRALIDGIHSRLDTANRQRENGPVNVRSSGRRSAQ